MQHSKSMQSNFAVQVEEIVDAILAYVDKASLISCITVDKTWFHGTAKLIWRCLDSPRPLIELLSPLLDKTETITETQWQCGTQRGTSGASWQYHYLPEFRTVTTLSCQSTDLIRWNRFNLYAPFVSHLKIVNHECAYDRTVISFIAVCRPSPMLPNLWSLEVDCLTSEKADYALELASFFTGESLKDLSIITDGTTESLYSLYEFDGLRALGTLLDVVASRAPNLRSFKLSYEDKLKACKSEESAQGSSLTASSIVFRFLCSLHNPKSIELCPRFASLALLTALPGIERVRLQCCQHECDPQFMDGESGETLDGKSASDSVSLKTLGYLEKLSTLALNIDYMTAISFLLSFMPSYLKQLEITSSKYESTRVSDLAVIIGKNCQNLHTLRLRSMDSIVFPSTPSLANSLRSLHQMRIFFFDQDVYILDYELKDLLRAWPLLEELQFVYRYSHLTNAATFTPDLLPFIAQQCPLLRKLTLKIDWNDISEPDLDTECRLSYLEHLDAGPLGAILSDAQISMIALSLNSLSIPITAVLTGIHARCPSGWANSSYFGRWGEVRKSMTLSMQYVRRTRELMHRIKVLEASEANWARHYNELAHPKQPNLPAHAPPELNIQHSSSDLSPQGP